MDIFHKNPWGTSLGKAFNQDNQDLQVEETGTAYYYGIDGEHAVYEVTAAREGLLIINGQAQVVSHGRQAVNACRANHIDLFSGWSNRP
ncbi:hypothetical protein [Tengunoibacter tsumagoiensis]|uniref:Uncharacterized protein n=1 Tax=Tengunoibacter tsumagoiensis TaxID=2014871 RepID=A0A402A838_9CHLR|nr:hypothetical protein [Tengunoibacter tsumagoiensis]GCE15312.1 hypothetical protein KTT_51710 [Tengunoibacter tsumagoiensis]